VRVVNVFQSIFAEIIREVSTRGHGREFLAAANAALKSHTLSESPVLHGLELGAGGSFDAPRLLDTYLRLRPKLGSEPSASLRQALSDVMLFLLFQASDVLGERKLDEELARRAKELLATLGGASARWLPTFAACRPPCPGPGAGCASGPRVSRWGGRLPPPPRGRGDTPSSGWGTG